MWTKWELLNCNNVLLCVIHTLCLLVMQACVECVLADPATHGWCTLVRNLVNMDNFSVGNTKFLLNMYVELTSFSIRNAYILYIYICTYIKLCFSWSKSKIQSKTPFLVRTKLMMFIYSKHPYHGATVESTLRPRPYFNMKAKCYT